MILAVLVGIVVGLFIAYRVPPVLEIIAIVIPLRLQWRLVGRKLRIVACSSSYVSLSVGEAFAQVLHRR